MAKKKNNNKKKKTQIETIDFKNTTPVGDKKDTSGKLYPSYHHEVAESAWYDWWNKEGFFKADENTKKKEKFVIMLPPPNVTGALHLGHALTVGVQDCLVRWNRMKGKEVLYLPGTDHAGIATQVVVEKKLQNQGITRQDLGREKFLEKVWEWKNEYGGKIINQLKRTAASLDWDREIFTMDKIRTNAVMEAFILFHKKGLIYRDNRLVNWCSKLKTAISNIEVEYEDFNEPKRLSVPGHKKKYDFGWIWDFAYPIENSTEKIIVSTTRPETMLGDTGIAIHPEDERYKHLHGKFAIHPFNGRKIPIVCDSELVDPKFGTGAVKVTPAHDPHDFQCGKKHNLDFIDIFDDDGKMNKKAAPFTGMMRFDARDAVIKGLEEKGLYLGRKKHQLNIGKCSRSKDIIEPRIKPQWFCDCKKLAKEAVKAVKNGELKITPKSEEKTWFRWLENIQDWCISRQLWWGHRIPAYFATVKGEEEKSQEKEEDFWFVGKTKEEALEQAAKKLNVKKELINLEQDEDVLDTWFSSGLFPFYSLGWPENNKSLETFYPSSLLETGTDILFFWVARMVMMGIGLTGKIPFKEVFLHAMVRDKFGKKMSKSSGNVIDPIYCIEGCSLKKLHESLLKGNLPQKEIERATKVQKLQFPDGIPKCGTDALRFTLLNYCQSGRDVNLDIMRVFGYRTFCNKIWNATNFAMINLKGFKPSGIGKYDFKVEELSFVDKWILSMSNQMVIDANDGLEKYDFAKYTTCMYDFFLKSFCDIYLELIKPVMNGKDEKQKKLTQSVLYICLERFLRTLHPTMPFITEELWQHLPGHEDENLKPEQRSIMINPYPLPIKSWDNKKIEKEFMILMNIINSARSIKGSYCLTNKQKPEVFICCGNDEIYEIAKNNNHHVENLAFTGICKPVKIENKKSIPEGCAHNIVNDNCDLYLKIVGLVDVESEMKKLKKKKEKNQSSYDRFLKKTQGPNYSKVPEKIKTMNKEKMEQLLIDIEKIEESYEALKKFIQK